MPRWTIALVTAAVLAAAGGVASTAAGAHPGRLSIAGAYEVIDPGATDCVPLTETGDRLRCRTTGFQSLYSGDLVGTSTIDFVWKINCTAGRASGHGLETFSGELADGRAAGLTWRLRFRSHFDCATFVPSGLRATGVVRSGTGALAGRSGVIVFDDVSYAGVLR